MITPIDMFEAGARYRKAHKRALDTGAFARNYDNITYSGIRCECKEARHQLEWGVMQMKTAAIQPEYARRMGW